MNFKHLLGRAPENQGEISKKIAILSSDGYDAVIDSIVDSAEYLEVFGSDVVPYARSWSSPADLSTAAFPLLAALSRSFAGSDSARGGSPVLTRNLASGTAQESVFQVKPSALRPHKPVLRQPNSVLKLLGLPVGKTLGR